VSLDSPVKQSGVWETACIDSSSLTCSNSGSEGRLDMVANMREGSGLDCSFGWWCGDVVKVNE
jgi:hypothetical protein